MRNHFFWFHFFFGEEIIPRWCNEVMPRQWCCTNFRPSGCMEGQPTTWKPRTEFSKSSNPLEMVLFPSKPPNVTDPWKFFLTPPHTVSRDGNKKDRMSIHSNEPSCPLSKQKLVSCKQLLLWSVENTNFINSKSQYTQEHEKSQTEHLQSRIRDVVEDLNLVPIVTGGFRTFCY